MKKGFTLIELLVVVLIIGILASVALPQYDRAVKKSRAAELLTARKSIMDAQEVYRLANGSWAPDLDSLDITVPNLKNYDMTYIYSSVQKTLEFVAKQGSLDMQTYFNSSGSSYSVCFGADCRVIDSCVPFSVGSTAYRCFK